MLSPKKIQDELDMLYGLRATLQLPNERYTLLEIQGMIKAYEHVLNPKGDPILNALGETVYL